MAGRGQTWQDLLQEGTLPPAVIGRRALLAEFARLGAALDERQLRNLEAQGMLPRPVRQYHEGTVQAVYPEWMPEIVADVWQQRTAGVPVALLVEGMPRVFKERAAFDVFRRTGAVWLDQFESPVTEELRRMLGEMVALFPPARRIRTIAIAFFEEGKSHPTHSILWDPPPGPLSVTPPADEPTDEVLSVAPTEPAATDR